MRMIQIGKKSLRLLVFLLAVVCVLVGCGASQYAPLDQMTTAQVQGENSKAVAFTIEDGGSQSEHVSETDAAEGAALEETIVYEEVHDWVTVTADALNVRAEDNTSARIYVQLHPGDVLERVGYHEEWSKVMYEGEVAYVATAMIEVTEEPTEMEEALRIEAVAKVSAENGNADENTASFNGHVVAIDAGHQAKANAEKEPIGPGSSTKKAKMPEGAVGAATGVREYELTLTVAKKLEAELREHGYEVVMIRTGHDVNLSNAERSVIANESDADIFIRLHANSMENSGIYGALAMCMTEYNPYNSELYQESYDLSKKIINNICKRTGTKNRGVQKVDNSSAINWCEIPVSVIEMGFLTNPDEDRWLQSEEYQGKIVEGIAEAIDSYFAEEMKETE